MNNDRRLFLKISGMAGMGMLSNPLAKAFSMDTIKPILSDSGMNSINSTQNDDDLSLIGQYGKWASSLNGGKLPLHSFRREEWTDLEKWRSVAKDRLMERLAIPDLGNVPSVSINKQYQYDGLQIEELSWQLPYGRATEGILLKPSDATGPLPGILAFHDHGGNKYFGKRKITKTSDKQHEVMVAHQEHYYEGMAWANEIAKRGYVVLVADAFPFASRRVMLQDVPDHLRQELNDDDPENPENIKAYNQWASSHEDIMAKSLFSAGTTWPGVFLAEDQIALDVLCAREDVDAEKIGCGGLSGGGMRTAFMGGIDPRIKCAVCVGFMTTWDDFILNKSFTHTWMTYVPLSPKELNFPEILGLRVPLPTMVLNDIDDGLYTMPEMKKADEILRAVFEKANASDKYRCSFYPGPHKFDQKMQSEAFDWFDQWLKS
jgi:dienelactone hydrolase